MQFTEGDIEEFPKADAIAENVEDLARLSSDEEQPDTDMGRTLFGILG